MFAVQGAPLSPLLANLNMRRFVRGCLRCFENTALGHEQRLQARIVNSAADFAICCKGMAELLRYNLKAVRAYLLKEEFQQFWEYVSPKWAGKFLDEWTAKVMRSRLAPLKKVARTLRGHQRLILNWFQAKGQVSSGAVEGLNNQAKLVSRKSHGFRTSRVAELALLHQLGNLSEKQITHRFC